MNYNRGPETDSLADGSALRRGRPDPSEPIGLSDLIRARNMQPVFSVYLDLLRFGAAGVVFLGHASADRLTGGLVWPLMAYGHVAVMVFFVRTGLVIAWSAETKEHRAADYFCQPPSTAFVGDRAGRGANIRF
jgi:peptidoglycan/LPS O-acetylase OafA/YrhL